MSASPELITAIVGSAGIAGAASSFITAKAASKKVPAEVDSIIANGAETTVQAALAVAAAEAKRADHAEAQVRERDAHIESLLRRIDQLQAALDAVRDEVHALRAAK